MRIRRVNLIVLFFIVGVVIYPTAYLIHKIIANEYQETFVILSKDTPYPSFLSCTYEVKLKNKEAIIRKCLPSREIYNRVILNTTVKVRTNKSFFGLTIDSFEIELK
jgi:hypothetical protein